VWVKMGGRRLDGSLISLLHGNDLLDVLIGLILIVIQRDLLYLHAPRFGSRFTVFAGIYRMIWCTCLAASQYLYT